MCGICGFTGTPDNHILRRMNDQIFHRGPDDAGYIETQQFSFAMRRLSIVDLAEGQQPVINESGTISSVCNGEIYNYRQLREHLLTKGHKFSTDHLDIEVIPHLYEECGAEWVKKVNGMFGVALWDDRTETLLLYRDRIGKKPLYYSFINGDLAFASEIKSLRVHPLVSDELDYKALYSYFGLKNISAPRTAFKDIKQLLPGHYLKWQRGKDIVTVPYWQVNFANINDNINEQDAAEEILRLLDNAVKLRLDCDAPYGAYLSGGVDSSSVAALMRKHVKNKFKTFCLIYDESSSGQFLGKNLDRDYSRLMSKRLYTEHFEEVLTPEKFAAGMAGVQRAFDEPFSGTCSTYFLTPLIQSQVKVALSGDGADELFGSYLSHRIAQPLEKINCFLQQGKNDLKDLTIDERKSLTPYNDSKSFNFLKQLAFLDTVNIRDRLSVFTASERLHLLSPEFLIKAEITNKKPAYDAVYANINGALTASDALNKALEIDQHELLPNQVLPFVDRLSMAFSVEVRCPYLDYRMIEFANSLPGRLKIKSGINKYIHKLAMKQLLPEDLLSRSKEGFVQPNYTWLHGPLKEWGLAQLRDIPVGFFNMDYVEGIFSQLAKGSTEINAKIWNLICFTVWYKECIG